MSDTILQAARLAQQNTPFVWVTLTALRGYAPQEVGAKIIVTEAGLYGGTVGGGKVEAKCIAVAQDLLNRRSTLARTDRTFSVTWNLQSDVGMSCGGEVSFLFELHGATSWNLVVFGAGHVAQKLARILKTLDCQATFVDSRPEWLSRLPKSPRIRVLELPEPKDYVHTLPLSDDSEAKTLPMFVIMTRGHAFDVPVLREVLKRFPNSPYIGVIGSKVKGIKIKNEMKAEGFSQSLVDSIRIPMGLPIGNNEPAEIAISIAAELLQVRG